MIEADRIKYLRIVLLLVGMILFIGVYHYDSFALWLGVAHGSVRVFQMILGIYATLGMS